MTTPVPGFVPPNPRTWTAGDFITTPRLRGDMTNLAYLYAGRARPLLLTINASSPTLNVGSNTLLGLGNLVPLNTWNVALSNSGSPFWPASTYYNVPLAGWYLVQANLTVNLTGAITFKYAVGFDAVINGAAAFDTDGGALPCSSNSGFQVGMAGLELFQMNTYANTLDTLAMYGFTNNTGASTVSQATFAAEWVGLPTSGLTDYTGPYGTVVSSPQAAAAFPSGPGTYITNGGGIAAGATSMTVQSNAGMITGGTLGLDYTAGTLFAPVAEKVSITSVSGTTIGISATSYAHLQNAPVAVPVSAAFLNQQSRDTIRFLAYPPMLRATTTTTQALASQNVPTGTQITNLSATQDNFSGFASNVYTVPVSGIYLVYGQVYFSGSTSVFTFGAGISISGGTIQWGTSARSATSPSSRSFCATVQRNLRLTAGQTIALYGFQFSGAGLNTTSSGPQVSKLIALWRST